MVNEEIIDTMVRMAKEAKLRGFISDGELAGACILTTDGTLYSACTLENSTGERKYCAPRVVIAKAIADGKLDFDALAIVQEGELTGICGDGLAMLREMAIPDLILCNMAGDVKVFSVAELEG